MLLRGIDAEAQHHNIEKSRLRQYNPACTVIVARMEMQLVNATAVVVTLQHWRIATTIVVGFNAGEQLKLSTFNPVQLDFQRASRAPVGSIQYVCGQSSHRLWISMRLKQHRYRTSSTFVEFGGSSG